MTTVAHTMPLTVNGVIEFIKDNKTSLLGGVKFEIFAENGEGGLQIQDLTESTVSIFPAAKKVGNDGESWLANYSMSPRFERSKIVRGGGFYWGDIDTPETALLIKILISRAKKHQFL